MTRESAHDRGRRLLVEGRLILDYVDGSDIRATCRGDSGEIHRLGHSGGTWWCTCPARTRCAHTVALQLVVVPNHSEVRS